MTQMGSLSAGIGLDMISAGLARDDW